MAPVRVCPQPMVWNAVHKRLLDYARGQSCTPAKPPVPLILAGWDCSNDVDKMERWQEMVAWATRNGCAELVADVADKDFYVVSEPTSFDVGRFGGPTYRPWDFDTKERPRDDDLTKHLQTLKDRWPEIAGPDLAATTAPAEFSGEKARCLVVAEDGSTTPPWGSWAELSPIETKRRTFTRLRAAINDAIAPHEVDHVVFHSMRRAQGSSSEKMN